MIQQSDNAAALDQPMDRYILINTQKTTEVVFFLQIPISEPDEGSTGFQLAYQGPEEWFAFTGDENDRFSTN